MNEREAKIAALLDYFSKSRRVASVHADWDFDRKCAAFRFDENARFYLLKISAEVLDDYSRDEIVKRLEAANWHRVLDELSVGGIVVLTSQGFKPQGGLG